MSTFPDNLLDSLSIRREVPLAPFTTWKVGGPAEYYAEAPDRDTLVTLVRTAEEHAVDVTILGWGSNVLIADRGIRGLVIRNRSAQIEPLSECEFTPRREDFIRLQQLDTAKYYSFSDLDYPEEPGPGMLVWLDSGVSLGLAINKLISDGLTGLQWFSGIPGTIGGAVYNNIHGGSHFISEYVRAVEVFKDGTLYQLSADELDFGYDYSRFHSSGEVIVRVQMCLARGNREKARAASVAWAQKKKLQPHNSAGCCYANLSEEERERLGLESIGWGYIIDQILKLKGTQRGGAVISEHHAAFIENTGSATAGDIFSLLKLVSDTANEKLGIRPQLEVFLLGFTPEERSQLIS
ncbi:MAG: UDP-N-acetylenolpyruvoylglucosamine reductase [candidate division WS6 bacterium OLB20]|uniref:UDP-N-acetylenolpyruvoylglucosamine reductase n=1 Tax=candidate division WS6 bacterium OLB20 TaxID=1617426 RepID=A0A136LXY8_9BACT|nr:MAG: UDP-N-acetylenolpyruvoylglucosamine reductase [candidate division WS6 bacterium OLB20]